MYHANHVILHAIGVVIHQMNRSQSFYVNIPWGLYSFSRPDRDSHITIDIKPEYVDYMSPEDLRPWTLGENNYNKFELSKLATNYDVNSVMHYSSHFGFRTFNDFYNKIGFGNSINLTATDKIELNTLYSCHEIKRNIYEEVLNEERERNYIELTQLSINPNSESQR